MLYIGSHMATVGVKGRNPLGELVGN